MLQNKEEERIDKDEYVNLRPLYYPWQMQIPVRFNYETFDNIHATGYEY